MRMAEEVHEKLTIPRDVKRQINRNNLPVQSIEKYCKGALVMPVLDTYVSKMKFILNELNCNKPNYWY